MSNSIKIVQIPTLPSLECLDMSALAGLSEVPALIIENSNLGYFGQASEVARRTDLVGNALASLTRGVYVPEFRKARFETGIPAHVDGEDVQRFWQANTAFSKEARPIVGQTAGARITIDAFKLSQPLGEEVQREVVLKGQPLKSHDSSLFLRNKYYPSGSIERRGIIETLKRKNIPAPHLVRSFEGFVPLGATVIFVNGVGGTDSDMLFTHSTRSAFRVGEDLTDTYLFWRTASLGRVEPASRIEIQIL